MEYQREGKRERERGRKVDACARGVVAVAVAVADVVVVVVVVILFVADPLSACCVREEVDGHPIPSYPPNAILSRRGLV